MTTRTWHGVIGNAFWENAAGWTPAGVPGVSDNAIIATSALGDVTVRVNDSINNLTIESGMGVNLYFNSALTVHGGIGNGGGAGLGTITLNLSYLHFVGAQAVSNVTI